MTAVQVADGVWRLPTAPADLVNSYLLAGADGSLVLLDAGTRRAPAGCWPPLPGWAARRRTSRTCCSATPTPTTPAGRTPCRQPPPARY
jgi:hypothetical protein